MSYTIYQSDGTQITIPDNAIDTEFYNATGGGGIGGAGQGQGIQLLGRNTVGYGASVAQNFVQLTENFCSSSPPADANALQGQLWFNQSSATSGSLYVRFTTQGTAGGVANWAQLATVGGSVNTATNIAGGAAGELPYQTGSGVTGFTGVGTAGQVLLSGGAGTPTWASQSALSVGESTNISGGLVGEVPYQTAAGLTSFIGVGTDGQVLTLAGGLPVWENPPAASVATNVVVTDNLAVSSATWYPTFVAAAGTQGVEVSSPNLTFVPSTGVLTATEFVGSGAGLTGTASGLTAGLVTNGLYTTNIGTLVPSPTGTGASGTWNINVNGNAATATNSTTATYSTTQATSTSNTTIATTAFAHAVALSSAPSATGFWSYRNAVTLTSSQRINYQTANVGAVGITYASGLVSISTAGTYFITGSASFINASANIGNATLTIYMNGATTVNSNTWAVGTGQMQGSVTVGGIFTLAAGNTVEIFATLANGAQVETAYGTFNGIRIA